MALEAILSSAIALSVATIAQLRIGTFYLFFVFVIRYYSVTCFYLGGRNDEQKHHLSSFCSEGCTFDAMAGGGYGRKVQIVAYQKYKIYKQSLNMK